LTISSFPLEIEKNIEEYRGRIYSSGEPEIEEILNGSPALA